MKAKFFLLLIAALLLFTSRSHAATSQDPADEIDRQMAFVDRVFEDFERERLRLNAEKQAKLEIHLAQQRKNTEARLAQQFARLSGTLNHLPEPPHFEGKFQTQEPEIPVEEDQTNSKV